MRHEVRVLPFGFAQGRRSAQVDGGGGLPVPDPRNPARDQPVGGGTLCPAPPSSLFSPAGAHSHDPPTHPSEVRMSNPLARRALASLVLLAGCSPAWQPSTFDYPTVTMSAEERAVGYRPLFDGASLFGWRIYHGTGTGGWKVRKGI